MPRSSLSRRPAEGEFLLRLLVGGGERRVPIAQRLPLMIQPQVEHQFRSERPHPPENNRPDDKPNEPIGRGEVDLRAGGFGFGSAQDVVWDRCKIKPARKLTDYRDGSSGWQDPSTHDGVIRCAWRPPSTGPAPRSGGP